MKNQFRYKKPSHSFTIKGNGILNVLAIDIQISAVGNGHTKRFKTKGIFDTGATHTVITKEVCDQLNLSPIGIKNVNTASQSNVRSETFIVDIHLKDDFYVTGVEVTQGVIAAEQGFHCLIGMDIISLGDFSITNLDNKTCLSFRVPSLHEVDFVAQFNKEKEYIDRHFAAQRGMNNPCICDSGKKFKNCHGKSLEENK